MGEKTNSEFPDMLLKKLTDEILNMDYIHLEDIPNIDLYMDQVTTFMDTRLKDTKRNPQDKILTKTMINNYAKNNLLPPPVKKKYSKNHILFLTFIYYLKSFMSIKDIESVLSPLRALTAADGDSTLLPKLYEEMLNAQKKLAPSIVQSVEQAEESAVSMAQAISDSFTGQKASSKLNGQTDSLTLFALIANLSFDIYMKKMLLEKLIDTKLTPKDTVDKEKKK